MMTKLTIATISALLLAAFVFGTEKLWSYVRGGGQVLNAQLDSSTPLPLEVARIRMLIDSQAESIQKYDDTLLELQGRSDAAARVVTEIRNRLDGEKKLLEEVKTMLDRKQTSYLIGRRQYSLAEVSGDALARLDSCKRMQEELAFQTSLKTDLDKAVEQGRRGMTQARRQHSDLTSQLARLEARDANADVRNEVAALTGGLNGTSLGQNSELERAFLNLERRVTHKERRISSIGGDVRTTALIDYSATVSTDDATIRIGQFLAAEQESIAPVTATTCPEPPETLSPVVRQSHWPFC